MILYIGSESTVNLRIRRDVSYGGSSARVQHTNSAHELEEVGEKKVESLDGTG